MRPIWRHTLGVATVAIVAATAAARPRPSARTQVPHPPHRRIVSCPSGERRPQDRHPHHRRQSPRHRGRARGSPVVTVLPREDGSVPSVETRQVGKDVYVYPVRCRGRAVLRQGGRGAFNVTALVAMGYDDASTDTVPVIARYTTDLSRARSAPVTPKSAAKGQTALDRRHRAQGRQGPGR